MFRVFWFFDPLFLLGFAEENTRMLHHVERLLRVESNRIVEARIPGIENNFPGATAGAGRQKELNVLVMGVQAEHEGVVTKRLAITVDIVHGAAAESHTKTAHPTGFPFVFCHLMAIGTKPFDVLNFYTVELPFLSGCGTDFAVLEKPAAMEIGMSAPHRDQL